MNREGKMLLVDLSGIFLCYAIFWVAVVFIGHLDPTPQAVFIGFKKVGINFKTWPDWFWITTVLSFSTLIGFIGLNPFRTEKGEYGDAHWATISEIKKMQLFSKTGIILAKKGKKYIRYADALCTLCFAPPGSGKTAGFVIPMLLSYWNSVIVHDPKGELIYKTGLHRSKFSRIIKFSPADEDSMRWNPLAKNELPAQWADKEVLLERLSFSMICSPDGKEDYFITTARSFFMFWGLYLLHKEGSTSMPGILQKALSGNPQELIAEVLDEAGADQLPSRILIEGRALVAKGENEFGSIMGTFKTAMNVCLDPRVAKNLSGESEFSLMDLRRECTSVYLTVKPNDQMRVRPLLAMFFEVATLQFMEREPSKSEKSVCFVLDEFVRLGNMKQVLEMPALGRGYRLQALFVCQSLSQLKGIYGKEGADQLINTCGFHLYYGQNEIEVAKMVSEMVGKITRIKKSRSLAPGKMSSTQSESSEGVPLILPQQILSMEFGSMFILRQYAFQTPVKCEASFWFKCKVMKALIPKDGLTLNLQGLEVSYMKDETLPEAEIPAAAEEDENGFVEIPPAREETPAEEPTQETTPAEPGPEIEAADQEEAEEPETTDFGDIEASTEEESPAIDEISKPEIEEEATTEAETGEIEEEAEEPAQVEPVAETATETVKEGAGVCDSCSKETDYPEKIGEVCLDITFDGQLCEGIVKQKGLEA